MIPAFVFVGKHKSAFPLIPIQNISYAFVAPLRKNFTSKSLWIVEDLWTDVCWLVVFGLGSINKNFMNRKVMIPTMAIEEFVEMFVYGLRHVIPDELRNETMDYCEWKNGYRVEAMTGVAKGLVTKIQAVLMNSFRSFVLAKIGYVQGQAIGTQSDSAKWWLFALGTGIPVITSCFAVIPKFFYPINDKTRDAMYTELAARRKAVADKLEKEASSVKVTV